MQTLLHEPWTEANDFTIGLKPIAIDRWFEGGEADVASRKTAVHRRNPSAAWGAVAGSHEAQSEAYALVGRSTGRLAPGAPSEDPLFAAALLVSDDLCLMERHGGEWTLTAASLSAPSFISAAEVVGQPLSILHAPVPGFGARMLPRVARIFDNLRPGVILERRSWSLLNSAELFLPDPAPVRARVKDLTVADAGSALHLRVERQTLRRLPETGGLIFTIRVHRWPLDALTAAPDRVAAFAAAWRTASSPFRAYKRLELYDELVKGWLAERGV